MAVMKSILDIEVPPGDYLEMLQHQRLFFRYLVRNMSLPAKLITESTPSNYSSDPALRKRSLENN